MQQALGVREGTVWEQCSTQVQYEMTDMLRPMMPYYQRLLDNYDINILVFSGVRDERASEITEREGGKREREERERDSVASAIRRVK